MRKKNSRNLLILGLFAIAVGTILCVMNLQVMGSLLFAPKSILLPNQLSLAVVNESQIVETETFQDDSWKTRWNVMVDVGSYPNDCWDRSWYGSISTTTIGGQKYNKAIRLYEYAFCGWCSGTYNCPSTKYARLETKYPRDYNYLSFVVVSGSGNIIFKDGDGSELKNFGISGPALYEFFFEGGNMYAVKDGISQGILLSRSAPAQYVQLYVGTGQKAKEMVIDDLTTSKKNILTVIVQSGTHDITYYCDDEIDLAWHTTTLPYESYKQADYFVVVNDLTTNEVVDSQIVKTGVLNYTIGEPYGYLKYSKNSLMGLNYGAYLFSLLKEDEVLDYDWLVYRELPAPEVCTQEFYVNTTSGLPVPGAGVEIRNAVTNELIGVESTGVDGMVVFDLPTDDLYALTITSGMNTTHSYFAACAQNPYVTTLSGMPDIPVIGDIPWWLLCLVGLVALGGGVAYLKSRKKGKKKRKGK